MRKKIVAVTFAFLLILPSVALAIGQNLNNYLYVHTNQAGTHDFVDKYGNAIIRGDAVENDATFTKVVVQIQGRTAGDKIYAVFENGQRQEITSFGSPVTLNNQNSKTIRFLLEKTSTNEVLAKVTELDTLDQTGGGTHVEYYYTASTPTSYGELGDGDSSGGATCTITATLNGSLLAWNVSDASNFYQVQIKKNGTHFGYMGGMQGQVDLRSIGQGTYSVSAVDMQKNVLCSSNSVHYAGEGGDPPPDDGGEDPPPDTEPPPEEGGCNGCGFLAELLSCPLWEVYMSDLTDAISDAIPPPPDWNYVSGVFADRIAPAVAQQILNVTPAMADIFSERMGDELDERLGNHDWTPGYYDYINDPTPTLDPNVPDVPTTTGKDLPQKIDFKVSDTEGIPVEFHDGGFDITDPMSNLRQPTSTPPIPGESRESDLKPNPTEPTENPKPEVRETPIPTPEYDYQPPDDINPKPRDEDRENPVPIQEPREGG
jgi:hypothetical protein